MQRFFSKSRVCTVIVVIKVVRRIFSCQVSPKSLRFVECILWLSSSYRKALLSKIENPRIEFRYAIILIKLFYLVQWSKSSGDIKSITMSHLDLLSSLKRVFELVIHNSSYVCHSIGHIVRHFFYLKFSFSCFFLKILTSSAQESVFYGALISGVDKWLLALVNWRFRRPIIWLSRPDFVRKRISYENGPRTKTDLVQKTNPCEIRFLYEIRFSYEICYLHEICYRYEICFRTKSVFVRNLSFKIFKMWVWSFGIEEFVYKILRSLFCATLRL